MTSSDSQRYICTGKGSRVAIKVDGTGRTGAIRALVAWSRLLGLKPFPKREVNAATVADGDLDGQPMWEYRYPDGTWIQAIAATVTEEVCGTAKQPLDARVDRLLTQLRREGIHHDKATVLPSTLMAAGINEVGVLWLVTKGWLTEELWYRGFYEVTPVRQMSGACGKPFYFKVDETDPEKLGERVNNQNVEVTFFTSKKLDELRRSQ